MQGACILSKRKSILIVEDDIRLADFTATYLDQKGFDVQIEHRGDNTIERIRELNPNLVILDIQLPGLDGLSICREVRPTYKGPIIMLTASGEDMDKVVGLEVGADNYLAKPVSPRVLLAHIRAALRRVETNPTSTHKPLPDTVRAGKLIIEGKRRIAILNKKDLLLSSAEFDLLSLLALHAGEVISRDEIYRKLQGKGYDGMDRTVDARISRLRKIMGDNPRAPRWIKTVHGVGYILVPEE
ncbi:MAG: response regulator [Proteobacteria bacterium]|nr:response regulator [Pseudomonadota bacterium]